MDPISELTPRSSSSLQRRCSGRPPGCELTSVEPSSGRNRSRHNFQGNSPLTRLQPGQPDAVHLYFDEETGMILRGQPRPPQVMSQPESQVLMRQKSYERIRPARPASQNYGSVQPESVCFDPTTSYSLATHVATYTQREPPLPRRQARRQSSRGGSEYVLMMDRHRGVTVRYRARSTRS